jgi:hypothetical protein
MTASVLGIFLLTASSLMAQGNGNGRGKGHGKGHDKHGDDDDQVGRYYNQHDQEEFHGWYLHNENHLPPGLAKKDHLPPGLENNWCGAERFHLACKRRSSPALERSNGCCHRRHLIAQTW